MKISTLNYVLLMLASCAVFNGTVSAEDCANVRITYSPGTPKVDLWYVPCGKHGPVMQSEATSKERYNVAVGRGEGTRLRINKHGETTSLYINDRMGKGDLTLHCSTGEPCYPR